MVEWWNMPTIPALRRQRQKEPKFKASPGKVKETLSQKQNTDERAGMCLKW
jgi:hypothetical protein